jgi:Family of unknown function (DUF5636)
MAALKTPLEIRNEIQASFPAVIDKAANSRVWASCLADYCTIGSLLTDHEACLEHLRVLNDKMQDDLQQQLAKQVAEARNGFRVNQPLAQYGQLDAVRVGAIVRTGGQNDNLDLSMLPKFYGILQRVLQREENRDGFNSTEVALPLELLGKAKVGQTPTLTGFFHPESFNAILLKQGYHWKDPGAGIAHGEFTHRIQWFIIGRASQSGAYATRYNPIKLYQSLALPPCIGTSTWVDSKTDAATIASRMQGVPEVFGKRTMWDLLVDCITDSSKAFGPRSPTFRCPEVLNLALINGGGKQWIKDNLPVLSNYLRARNTKRSYYENRDRMNDQFVAMQGAIDSIPGGIRFNDLPGKQEGDAVGRAVWRRDR